MAEELDLETIDWGSVGAKQRHKVFKSVQKDLKSKDIDIKLKSMRKLKDLTYIREGGCLPVFLQTLYPKKKVFDYVHDGLLFLSELLQSLKEEEVETHAFWMGVDSILSNDADLQVIFGGVLECICLKEEVKPSKKSKKVEPHVENPLVVSIRSLALKIFYYMMLPLLPTPMDHRFRLKLSMLTGLAPILFDSIHSNISKVNFEHPSQNAQDLQNSIYGVAVLVFVMRSNREAVAEFVAHPIAEYVSMMSKHPLLSVSACHILHLIVLENCGPDFFGEATKIELLLEILVSSKKAVVDKCCPAVETAPPKGKEVKKDDKAKKNAPVVVLEPEVDPYSQYDTIKIPDLRKHLVQLHLVTNIFIKLTMILPMVFEESHALRIFSCLKDYLLLERVWEEVCSDVQEPYNGPIRNFMWQTINLLGRISDVSTVFAMIFRKEGAMMLYLSSLIQSSDMYRVKDNHSMSSDNYACFLLMKRNCEKAIFSLFGNLKGDSTAKGRFLSANQYFLTPDEFYSKEDMTEKLNRLMQSHDIDGVMRGVRIVCAMCCALTSNGNDSVLHDLQLDKALLATLCNVCSKLLSTIIGSNEAAVQSEGHALDPELMGSLYLTISTMEQFMSFDCQNVKLCFDQERIAMIVKSFRLFGPLNGEMQSSELQVQINDPRFFDWQMEKSDKYFDQIYFLRPLLIDFVRHIIQSDLKYRVFETPEDVIGMDVPPSNSPIQEQCYMTVKLTIDSVIQLIIGGLKWSFNQVNQLVVMPGSAMVVDDVAIAALIYIQAIGELGPVVLSGCLGEIATSGFSSNWKQSSLCSFIMVMTKMGFDSPMESTQVKNFQFFSDLYSGTGPLHLDLDFCKSTMSVWSFFSMLGPLVAILNNREASPQVLIECTRAISSLVHYKRLSSASQPVVMDIMCTIFGLLGGIVQLVALMGRFSKIRGCADVEEILSYALARGYEREVFWKQWEQDHRVQVQIDPKTGKPIAKKDEKDKKAPTKDKKVDKNAPVEVPVFPEILLNKEYTPEYPDPNRGPSCLFWTDLLNECFPCPHVLSSNVSALSCAILGGQSRVLLPFLNFYPEMDINLVDFCGRTPLMYSLLLNDSAAVEVLLDKSADVNMVDVNGVPTILYSLSSLSGSTIDSLLPGFCPSPSGEIKIVRGKAYFLETLIKSGNVDVNVADLHGCSPLLFALGEGSIELSIGGYTFNVFNSAFSDPSTGQERETIVKLLVETNCNVNHCAKNGKVALHIACAEGDSSIIEILLRANCNPNLVDLRCWHSIHYITACCPLKAEEILDLILSAGNMYPVSPSIFCDYRTGIAENTKYEKELEFYFGDCLTEALLPLSLSAPRAKFVDLIHLLTEEKLTPLHLCCLGSSTTLRSDISVACDDLVHDRRVKVALRMLKLSEKENCLSSMVTDNLQSSMKSFHALAVLLKGPTKKLHLTEKQQRSKRIRYFDSDESELLSLFLENQPDHWKPELFCNYPMPFVEPFIDNWTPFHAIISNNNVAVLEKYINVYGLDTLDEVYPVAIMSTLKNPVNSDMASRIIQYCSRSGNWQVQLNGVVGLQDVPIHCAITNRQFEVVAALVSNAKVDLNIVSEVTHLTPIQAACLSKNVDLINCFRKGSDRVDLTIPLPREYNNTSLLEWLVQSNDISTIQILTDMRKMDILEMLLTEKDNKHSLLKSMELQRMSFDAGHSMLKEEDKPCFQQMLQFFQGIIDSIGGFGNEIHADGYFSTY